MDYHSLIGEILQAAKLRTGVTAQVKRRRRIPA